jgi:hypothetical protein
VAIIRKAADDIRIMIQSHILRKNNTGKLVATSNKLTNNFASLVNIGLGPDRARGPPI